MMTPKKSVPKRANVYFMTTSGTAAASAAGRATSHPTYVHSTHHAAAAAAADDADYDGATADNDDDAHTRVARVRFPGRPVAADAAA